MKYYITEKDGVFTATIPIPLQSGRVLLVKGRASVDDTFKEFGFTDENIGDIFGDIGKGFRSVSRWVKKATSKKSLRKALKVAKGITKSPIVTAAAGAIAGPGGVAAIQSANDAIKIAEDATKGGSKGQAARKLMRYSLTKARQDNSRKRKMNLIRRKLQKKPSNMTKIHALRLRQAALALKKKKAHPINDYLVKVHFA